MRIIPASVSPGIKSNAEKKVFQLLKSIDLPNSVCFHSLRLSDHNYKRVGEIDFLIVTPTILLVLEVKGGQISRNELGIWTMIDRSNICYQHHEGPFEQAASGLFSIRKAINTAFHGSKISNIGWGYGVIFPDVNFSIKSVEWADEMILDKHSFISPSKFSTSLKRLISYWEKKNYETSLLDNNEITSLVRFIRPNFDLAETLGKKVKDIEAQVCTLTLEQYAYMDAVETNNRILCLGGAGTGKTLLAMETAKRLSENGNKVLLVCKSVVLAANLSLKVSLENLSIKSIEKVNEFEKYDAIVIDEAQDIMNLEDLYILNRCLRGNLDKGIWRMFLDRNNQSGLLGEFDEAAFEFVITSRPATISLTKNCRNTERIVNDVSLITAADIGVATSGDGPQVSYRYYTNLNQAIEILEGGIRLLLDDEIGLSDITILSFKSFVESIANNLSNKLKSRITQLNEDNAEHFPFTNMCFSNIVDFKGLENKFVFIVDFPQGYFQYVDLNLIYVAMTRARVALILIISKDEEASINKLMITNLEKVRPELLFKK